MNKKIIPAAIAIATLGFAGAVAMPPQSADAATSYVKNISDGKRIIVQDYCWRVKLEPGVRVNMSCSGRQVYVNATDCVIINKVGSRPHTYCAGSRAYWQDFSWGLGTTTLERIN